jgi:hypothetical protein
MTGSTPHDTVEKRLSAALHVLADTQIPATAHHAVAESTSHSWKRGLSAAAAGLVVVCGGIGIVLLRSEPAPDVSQSIVTSVDSADEGVSNTVTASPPAATDDTRETVAPIGESVERERIAILDPEVGFGPAETLSEVDLWLTAGTGDNRRFAIRGRQTDDPVVLQWALIPPSEWAKTYSDQPDVELPDGRIAKRLVPTFVDVVNYAIQTDDGVFSASITPQFEAELARWVSNVAGTDLDTIIPPDGFQPIAEATGTLSVIYEDQTTLYTTTFDSTIGLADYIETRFPNYSLEPAGDQGAVIASPPANDGRGATLIWQPEPDLIVTMSGPPEALTRLADALTLSDQESADLSVRSSNRDLNITGDPDLTVLGETTEGRFAYTQTTLPDGSTCYTFFHTAHGGSSGCQDDTTAPPAPICGSGWSAPDEASASVFAISDVVPDIGFSLDGVALNSNIETGTAEVGWVFAWAREAGRASDDPPIDVTVNQSSC